MFEFIVGSHEFLGNHSFAEFLVGYIFGAALIIGAPTVFLLSISLAKYSTRFITKEELVARQVKIFRPHWLPQRALRLLNLKWIRQEPIHW